MGQDGHAGKPGLIAFLKSHPTGFWFIFWGEFAERASYYGMRAILATYMARELGLGEANSGTFLALFVAACYFLPLLGGYIADNYLGKFTTIIGFSVPYILGHVILGIENTTCLFIALTLLAMGAGVIKPNISPLMGLTYDQQRPGQELLRSQAFSMFYMAVNIGAGIAMFIVPVIRDHYGYFVAFLFPAALMAVAFVIFALGKPFYAVEVIVRKKKTPEDYALMLQVTRRVAGVFLLVAFFWSIFDQSASTWIFFGQMYQENIDLPGLYMTPERIQALNSVLIVILLPLIMYLWTVLERKGIKVKSTSKMMAGFFLTALCMAAMAWPGFSAGPLETLYVPLKYADAKFAAQDQARAALPDAYDATCVFGALGARGNLPALITGAASPSFGKEVYVRPENKASLWWQALAYVALTLAEILISVTGLEMAFVVAPKSMKGLITALWLLTVFVGNFFLNAPLGQLYPNMHPGMYFLMLTGMMVGVMAAFAIVAPRFNRLAETVAVAEGAKAG